MDCPKRPRGPSSRPTNSKAAPAKWRTPWQRGSAPQPEPGRSTATSSGFTRRSYTVAGPTGQPVQASIACDGATAIVEVANTCGLGRLPDRKLEPLNASSRGFGEAVLFALSLNPARIVLAPGGSASTNGGMGMLTALGYSFRDADGRELYSGGGNLNPSSPVMFTTLFSEHPAPRLCSDPKRAPAPRTSQRWLRA